MNTDMDKIDKRDAVIIRLIQIGLFLIGMFFFVVIAILFLSLCAVIVVTCWWAIDGLAHLIFS